MTDILNAWKNTKRILEPCLTRLPRGRYMPIGAYRFDSHGGGASFGYHRYTWAEGVHVVVVFNANLRRTRHLDSLRIEKRWPGARWAPGTWELRERIIMVYLQGEDAAQVRFTWSMGQPGPWEKGTLGEILIQKGLTTSIYTLRGGKDHGLTLTEGGPEGLPFLPTGHHTIIGLEIPWEIDCQKEAQGILDRSELGEFAKVVLKELPAPKHLIALD